VGIDGMIYDLTSFVHEHPGSPESLMENSGGKEWLKFNSKLL
jgi:cytochrome b involved in lipid metabolism